MSRDDEARRLKVMMISPFSKRYPSIGETHALSVLAASIERELEIEGLDILDMVGCGDMSDLDVISRVRDADPTVLCLSAGYGTYDRLRELYPGIRSSISFEDPLVIFGGALPTYLPERVLREIEPKGLVVIGEGDVALPEILRRWANRHDMKGIPNTCQLEDGRMINPGRALVDLAKLSRPYRKHVQLLAESGAQIFTEASRGCSWAACSFCLRGLTDVEGVKSEYRRFPTQRVLEDFEELNRLGITAVTFSDEDFLGGDASNMATFLRAVQESNQGKIQFDVSMTVHSACALAGSNLGKLLKDSGLRKVFLGIESGSASQLHRYAKGHSPADAAQASSFVLTAGLQLEIGFILFDPLATLDEIVESLGFLIENKLAIYVSSLANELRLQVGSRYLNRLMRAEHDSGEVLHSREVDPNTLCYDYRYLHPDVNRLVEHVKDWNQVVENLHYPLKNLSRYGLGGVLGRHVVEVRSLIAELREGYAHFLFDAALRARQHETLDDPRFTERLYLLLRKAARHTIRILSQVPAATRSNPVVARVFEVANRMSLGTATPDL